MEHHYCHSKCLCFQMNQLCTALIRKPQLLILCNNCLYRKILHENKLFIKPTEIKHQSHSKLSEVHSLHQIVPSQFQRLHSLRKFAYKNPYIFKKLYIFFKKIKSYIHFNFFTSKYNKYKETLPKSNVNKQMSNTNFYKLHFHIYVQKQL
jgi:hypothetical protein